MSLLRVEFRRFGFIERLQSVKLRRASALAGFGAAAVKVRQIQAARAGSVASAFYGFGGLRRFTASAGAALLQPLRASAACSVFKVHYG